MVYSDLQSHLGSILVKRIMGKIYKPLLIRAESLLKGLLL